MEKLDILLWIVGGGFGLMGVMWHSLNQRIDKLDGKIDKQDGKIDRVEASLSQKIDQVESNLSKKIDKLDEKTHRCGSPSLQVRAPSPPKIVAC